MPSPQIAWLSTAETPAHLGITTRLPYAEIDEGHLVAYKFGRVIRIKQSDIDTYLEASKIPPGSLGHLHRSGTETPEADDAA
jgi:excisionase family DNA binding protein